MVGSGHGHGSGSADPPSEPETCIHNAITTTWMNEMRELLVCLGRDGDTRLVGLHLADVVELCHPVARLHKPFLQQKNIIQSIFESINQAKCNWYWFIFKNWKHNEKITDANLPFYSIAADASNTRVSFRCIVCILRRKTATRMRINADMEFKVHKNLRFFSFWRFLKDKDIF